MARKVLYEGRYLRLISDDTWEYVERVRGNGIVVILAKTPQDKIIFIDQYRPAVKRRVVEFPAGLANDKEVKKKESLAVAAKRELLEETGYRTDSMKFVLEGPHAPGSASAVITFFRAGKLKKVAEGGGDESEDIHVYEVPAGKAGGWLNEMKKKGFWVDPKVYTGLYFLMNEKQS